MPVAIQTIHPLSIHIQMTMSQAWNGLFQKFQSLELIVGLTFEKGSRSIANASKRLDILPLTISKLSIQSPLSINPIYSSLSTITSVFLSPPRSTTQPGSDRLEIPLVTSRTPSVQGSFALRMFISCTCTSVLEWK